MPKVSIVMPVYNAERFLRLAVDSMLNQTFTDFELILVDDCSKDNSWGIMTEYAAQDSRVVLVRNEQNLGEAARVTLATSTRRGEYIAVQDADDISMPDRLERRGEVSGYPSGSRRSCQSCQEN